MPLSINRHYALMPNLILSLSNLYGLLAVSVLYNNNDMFGAIILSGTILSSMIYHLIEHHKHNLVGLSEFNLCDTVCHHQTFINFDRFFACSSVLYLLTYDLIIEHIVLTVIALICLSISETTQYIEHRIIKRLFVPLHFIWHILAFHLAYLFALKKIDL